MTYVTNAIRSTIVLLLVLLLVPHASALEFDIDVQDSIDEGTPTNAIISVHAQAPFDGTITLSYTNLNQTTDIVTFTQSQFQGTYYNKTISITGVQPGVFSVHAQLHNDTSLNIAQKNVTGNVNSSIPRIITSSPTGTQSQDTLLLKVQTNEEANCKYDTTDTEYHNMSSDFSNTQDYHHNTTLAGLSQATHTYYVRCKDEQGYVSNTSTEIEFTVDLPPSAQVDLDQDSPVKTGTFEITVLVSESLSSPPILQYSFNEAPNIKFQISLSGSGNLWKGFLIITEADDNKVGTFHFQATDASGNKGDTITSGNLFIVDASKPPAPQSVKAVVEPNGDIKLGWYYDGEEVDHFRVYRATRSGINYVDYYADSNDTRSFYDTATFDKVTYYYKISAVDKAGNEGPLSSEIFATSLNNVVDNNQNQSQTQTAPQNAPQLLPPDLIPEVDTFVKRIDALIIDVQESKSRLEEKTGDEKEVITTLQMLAPVTQKIANLKNIKQQALDFKNTYATPQELDEKLDALNPDLQQIQRTIPFDIEVLEQSDHTQSLGDDDVSFAATHLFSQIDLTEDEQKDFIKQNEKHNKKVTVESNLKIIRTVYLDQHSSEQSLITKKIVYDSETQPTDVLIIESIPKTVAESAKELDFLNSNVEILEDDPVIKFGFLEFSQTGETISYTLQKKVNAEELKGSKTVMLINPSTAFTNQPKSTGLAVAPFTQKVEGIHLVLVTIGILIIIGLIVYYVFFVKDYGYMLTKIKRMFFIKKLKTSVPQPPSPQEPFTHYHAQQNSSQEYVHYQSQLANQSDDQFLHHVSNHVTDIKTDLADKLLPLFVSLNEKINASKQQTQIKPTLQLNQKIYLNALIDQAHHHIEKNLLGQAKKIYPQIRSIYAQLPKKQREEMYQRCVQLQTKLRVPMPNNQIHSEQPTHQSIDNQ